MVTACKLQVNVLRNRLTPAVEGILNERQCVFRRSCNNVYAVFAVKQFVGKRTEFNLPHFLLPLALEEAYIRVDKCKF